MNIQAIAVHIDKLRHLYESGNISADEYKELIETANVTQLINEQSMQLEENIMYRNMIIAAINIAATLS